MNTRALVWIVLAGFAGALGGVIAGRELSTPPAAGGFRHVESGPLVRSSYHAWEQVQAAGV